MTSILDKDMIARADCSLGRTPRITHASSGASTRSARLLPHLSAGAGIAPGGPNGLTFEVGFASNFMAASQ